MKHILVALDDRCARELDRVAPAARRMRAEFVRLAIQSALDRALDRETAARYALSPLPRGVTPADLTGWDEANALARPARSARTRRRARNAA